jgi:hypothetical protein
MTAETYLIINLHRFGLSEEQIVELRKYIKIYEDEKYDNYQ